jgi:ABC-type transporter Mla maintaining outer membrane lipid asymmetry permease subunit MlaE
MSVQLAKELSARFGAEQLVGGIVAMAVVRELAAVITAIVVAKILFARKKNKLEAK